MRSLVAAFLLAVSAAAAAADPDAGVFETCNADLPQFCPGMAMGSEGAIACLREHKGEVSRACGDALAARYEAILERVREACSAEIANFCASDKSGARAPLHCLRSHECQLSPACRAALPRPVS